jgi:signal transduction histidine kinase
MNGSPQRSATSGCDVEDGPALAHDACNLLSALALYSELLGSPGVLEERDRHFAGELKLLASRSQILIDRLLRVAAMRQGPNTALRGQLKVSGLVDATPKKGFVETAFADHAASVKQVTADVQGAADVSSRIPEKVRSFSGTALDAGPAERSTLELPAVPDQNAATGSAQTNLVDLLMRWGSLLSTLAHGTLEVVFGTHASALVPAGAEALERILVNLVRNARAATAQGGAVRIGVGVDVSGLSTEKVREDREAAPGRVAAPLEISIRQTMVLTVDDSGCGMTEAQIQRILRDKSSAEESIAPDSVPAQQAASDSYGRWFGDGGDRREAASEAASRRAIAPNYRRRQGLGLQIVRELVAASGGTLSIQSWPGRGTRIEIRWPVTIAATTIAPVQEARIHPAGETPEAASAVLHAVQPIAVETPSPTIATGDTRDPAGPDGLSETELRAMMLRLHRAGPPERSPLSRRLGNRSESWREAERGLDGVEAGISGRGYKSAQRGTPAKRDAAPKGAIAC